MRFRIGALAALLTAAVPLAGHAQGRIDAGSYMAAQAADLARDHEASARFYTRALARDVGNPELLERSIRARINAGDVATAAALSERLVAVDPERPLGRLMFIAKRIEAGAYGAALEALEARDDVLLPLVSSLWKGWLLIATGEEQRGFAEFAALETSETYATFGRYHAGLAHAAIGEIDAATELLVDHPAGPVVLNERATHVRMELLTADGRRDAALAELDDILSQGLGNLGFERLRSAIAGSSIADGDTLEFSGPRSPVKGPAAVLHDLASVFGTDGDAGALIYTRVAAWLDRDLSQARLRSAEILSRQGQPALAGEAFARIGRADPLYADAQLGRARLRAEAGNVDGAVSILEDLVAAYPRSLQLRYELAETLRGDDRHRDAVLALDGAIRLAGAQGKDIWQLYYNRGTSRDALGDWPEAEADLRRALEVRPDQPFVQNYLGYSLVERRETLDEALAMIESAVAQEPQNGYILDSLAWALYRLDRFEEAVAPMERAVLLDPLDPILADHLGDIYWSVGRIREAQFQWGARAVLRAGGR